MIEHFYQHINLHKLILEKRPKVIVECGAGDGETTRMLAHMKLMYPFELVSITDKALDGIPGVDWRIGLSYKKLKDFPDESIGLCIIDTDHNFWTLREELLAVKDKMEEGGLIVLHDTESFYHDTGMAMAYWNGEPYPEKEILACSSMGGVADAMLVFLVECKQSYKLHSYSKESNGAAVLERRTVKSLNVIRPGTAPVFAPQK